MKAYNPHSAIWMAALAALICLCACSESAHKIKVGVSQPSDDEWRTKMNNEMLLESTLCDDVDLTILTSKDDNSKQAADIDALISRGVDVLAVSPNQAEALAPALSRARSKGIPVIVFDRKPADENYTAFIGADNAEIGRAAARYIKMDAKGRQVNVMLVRGLKGSSADQERYAGFMEVADASPNIKIIEELHGDWQQIDAHDAMAQRLLQKQLEGTDYVFAFNDRMALGAVRAAEEVGQWEDTRFLGVDGLSGVNMLDADADGLSSPYGAQLVQDGMLEATFLYPTAGDKVLRLALDVVQGREYEKENLLPTAVIDSVTAPVLLLQDREIASLNGKITTLHHSLDEFMLRYSAQKVALYALILAIVLAVALTVVALRAYWTKTRLNQQLGEDKLELTERLEQLTHLQQRLQDATDAKLRFFTNVSHDFRTPLTLVADPVNQLIKDPATAASQRGLLRIVARNVAILARLVNQILDFRTYENGRLQVNAEPVALGESLEQWCEGFRSTAAHRRLKLVMAIDEREDFHVVIDAEKTERIVYNLLSNAIKYTPAGGEIRVGLDTAEVDGQKKIRITVADTGTGMNADALGKIIERFYMIDRKNPGSGIGLALVKAFVEIQGGEISVESTPGEGTKFTVLLPFVAASDKDAATATAVNLITADSIAQEHGTPQEETAKAETRLAAPALADDDPRPLVLVVDDNADIRTYLRHILEKDYRVCEASNGKEGLEEASREVPDVVVCDVMMPVMDGLQCCRTLKGDVRTSHIPVVMLTACSLDEQRAKGYDCGADSYLSKPFSTDVMLSRLHNLLENRRRLSEFFSDRPSSLKTSGLGKVDCDFISRFRKVIDENLSNSELSVDDLAAQMALGRVQLYRKVKALTGSTPTDLLREARLRRADYLLAHTDKTISEIAYDCGFSSPSYFTRCYRDTYGKTPTESRE